MLPAATRASGLAWDAPGPTVPTRYWHELPDGRIQCDVCPRACKLHEGQQGLCFVRARQDNAIVLTSYGRSSGFCIDPIEKKPLNHYLPGTPILSFGTAGCNLACKFCVPATTWISTGEGMRQIGDLFAECPETQPLDEGRVGFPRGLEVWTREGKRAAVTKVFARPFDGELVSLVTAGYPPLRATPNHGIFVVHRSNLGKVRKVPAADLTTDHYLVAPRHRSGRAAANSFERARLEATSGLFAQGHAHRYGHLSRVERFDRVETESTFLVPVRRIEHIPYRGEVYNLEVDDPDHSYLAPFLAVANCQNWDISKSREVDKLADAASPEKLARVAKDLGCSSIAFTYNDPVVFHEYAIDTAQACHELGLKAVSVTAGYQCDEPRAEMYRWMDASNVDLKGFTEHFYYKICGGHLQPVLDTLVYLKKETKVWFEITTLLIPGENDSEKEIEEETQWLMQNLGPDVPLHFTAFHPDWKMLDKPHTPPATLTRARAIALKNGLHYVYTGNVHDAEGGTTKCQGCGAKLIVRDWYRLLEWRLTDDGRCKKCGTQCPGVFDGPPGDWGPKRRPVMLSAVA
jgi:pyruvate formate lyase activating enzyme